MQTYQHTQPGILVRYMMGGMLLLVAGIAAEAGGGPASTGLWIAVPILAVLLILFHSLTATIDERELLVSFGPGLIRKRFCLAEIQGASQVRNRWYYGWGIRLTPSGWMYNVSGYDAVELELASGKRFRVGTDDAKGLIAALEKARA